MIELLTLLRANGFKTYIVSGGTVEFMRPWTERTYGIPPEQVGIQKFVGRRPRLDGRRYENGLEEDFLVRIAPTHWC